MQREIPLTLVNIETPLDQDVIVAAGSGSGSSSSSSSARYPTTHRLRGLLRRPQRDHWLQPASPGVHLLPLGDVSCIHWHRWRYNLLLLLLLLSSQQLNVLHQVLLLLLWPQ